MAKNVGKGGGTSRIKFIMFDAEIADDQIPMVTQAITNALRGSNPPPAPRRLPSAVPLNGANGHGAAEEAQESDLFDEVEDGDGALDVAPAPTKPKGPRKVAPAPEVLPIDFNAFDVPLGTFAAEYKTESHQSRYLVAAAWFTEHGGVTKVTPAHIYSAYRWLKWPLTVKDYGQPLRDLKSDQLFTSSEKGTYTLHPVGLQRVAELKLNSGS
jgi:hypothetical protein